MYKNKEKESVNMGYSEIAVILFVYSGLVIFFLIPFQKEKLSTESNTLQINF